MPELPEVEIVRRGLEPALSGKIIRSANIRRRDLRIPIPENFARTIQERSVLKVRRRGKYILIFLESNAVIIMHLGMSGRIKIYDPGDPYELQKHDHVIIHMQQGAQIVFNDTRRFGMLYLSTANDWEKEKPFSSMGPEPLGNGFHGPFLEERLHGRKTSIKAALLDQSIVAGLGNIYVCEALYGAGIHPMREAGKVRGKEAQCLVDQIRQVLQKAIKAGGSSLKDYHHTDGTLGYFQNAFSVYDREDEKCPDCTCDDTVRRIVQAGRSSFFCPVKQV